MAVAPTNLDKYLASRFSSEGRPSRKPGKFVPEHVPIVVESELKNLAVKVT